MTESKLIQDRKSIPPILKIGIKWTDIYRGMKVISNLKHIVHEKAFWNDDKEPRVETVCYEYNRVNGLIVPNSYMYNIVLNEGTVVSISGGNIPRNFRETSQDMYDRTNTLDGHFNKDIPDFNKSPEGWRRNLYDSTKVSDIQRGMIDIDKGVRGSTNYYLWRVHKLTKSNKLMQVAYEGNKTYKKNWAILSRISELFVRGNDYFGLKDSEEPRIFFPGKRDYTEYKNTLDASF